MGRIRGFLLVGLLCASALSAALAQAAGIEAPGLLRPGQYYGIEVDAPEGGNASLLLLDASGSTVYTVYAEYPLSPGANTLPWDGRRTDHSVVQPGEYTLRLQMVDGSAADAPLSIGEPYPLISQIRQSGAAVGEEPVELSFVASEPGELLVQLANNGDGTLTQLDALAVSAGENVYRWNGDVGGVRVAEGSYALVLTLTGAGGETSLAEHVYVEVTPGRAAAVATGFQIFDVAFSEAEDDPPPSPPVSAPYSNAGDGTFWSMTPGELDDKVIWDILTQPIVVYDDGEIAQTGHVFLMENPDGTGAKIAQIHGKSQGLHVVGEVNEHGYVLVEAFSNYDPSFQPETDEARAEAFALKRGYIKASGLQTIEVQQDMALVIDKLTQRMYLFIDGVRVTEFLVATGRITDSKYYNETIPGEYITVSHTGDFTSGNMVCGMAIRINGGILLHEVPHKLNGDGTKNYSSFEGYLGTKQSHGCIRVQRLKTPEGYNHRWLWENFRRGMPYKVIIWDDLGRVDAPETWQPNPKN